MDQVLRINFKTPQVEVELNICKEVTRLVTDFLVSYLNCSGGLAKVKVPLNVSGYKVDEIIILIAVFSLWIAILSLFFHRLGKISSRE